ncbi:hypothetical protein N7505_007860 [Penicillium chrysogenum]|uniref:Uncharacterized protein n=1 Tax=Penicillium chrysogenum TaxID=5076 RepID=A0ABQ8WEN0_PENCH|nr:hypothetical protein N7505_007860 [Penicillium chrysogenum]
MARKYHAHEVFRANPQFRVRYIHDVIQHWDDIDEKAQVDNSHARLMIPSTSYWFTRTKSHVRYARDIPVVRSVP